MNPKMSSINPKEMAPRDAYRLMTSVIVPRPIAWVSTLSVDGVPNLAPFSFYNGVGGNPLSIMFSASHHKDHRPKDTLRNVEATGEFVVNVVDESLAQAMNQTSGEYDFGISEFEIVQLETAPSIEVRPPRVALAPVAMEAKLAQLISVNETNYTIVLGNIVRFHIRDGLLRPNGTVDPHLLRPLARLGGDEYATLGEFFEMPRPKV